MSNLATRLNILCSQDTHYFIYIYKGFKRTNLKQCNSDRLSIVEGIRLVVTEKLLIKFFLTGLNWSPRKWKLWIHLSKSYNTSHFWKLELTISMIVRIFFIKFLFIFETHLCVWNTYVQMCGSSISIHTYILRISFCFLSLVTLLTGH